MYAHICCVVADNVDELHCCENYLMSIPAGKLQGYNVGHAVKQHLQADWEFLFRSLLNSDTKLDGHFGVILDKLEILVARFGGMYIVILSQILD